MKIENLFIVIICGAQFLTFRTLYTHIYHLTLQSCTYNLYTIYYGFFFVASQFKNYTFLSELGAL